MSLNERTHYRNAPIVEAAIDIRCLFPNPAPLATLSAVQERLAELYPLREDLLELRAQIGPAAAVTSQHTVTGIRLLNPERTQVVALTGDGFTFSRLAPYDRWETLRDEAFRIWGLYREVTAPPGVSRVGVRYVNRLDLPRSASQGVELDQFLRTAPKIAPELPQSLESFFLRFQLALPGPRAGTLIITEAVVEPTSQEVISVVLDIDVFASNLDTTSEQAWEFIERFRDQKNLAFESCITEATRALIR